MSAIIPRSGPTRQLDAKAEPREQVTPEQVKDTSRLVELLMRMLRDLAALRSRWWPKVLEFQDIDLRAGGVRMRLTHGFGSPASYAIVRWVSPVGSPPVLHLDADASDRNTLAFRSYVSGVATIQIVQGG